MIPKTYRGFIVSIRSNGYIYLTMSVDGKQHKIYIGNKWDAGLVDAKIKQKFKNGLDNMPQPKPKNEIYKGWTISFRGDGNFWISQLFDKETVNIYIGKAWTYEILDARIAKAAIKKPWIVPPLPWHKRPDYWFLMHATKKYKSDGKLFCYQA